MANAEPIIRQEIPNGVSRLQDVIKIFAGPDVSDILGLNSPFATPVQGALTQLSTNSILPVAMAQEITLHAVRSAMPRFAFGPDTTQPFQVIPFNQVTDLTLDWISLRQGSPVELLFNFLPDSLLEQQYPFVISIDEPGDPAQQAAIGKIHWFLGCWFTDKTVKYSFGQKNRIMIPTAHLQVGRYTCQSNAKGTGLTTQAAVTGVGALVTSQPSQNLILNLGLG